MKPWQVAGFVTLALVVLLVLLSLWSPHTSMPDLRVYPAGEERKAAFFTFLEPIVEHQNAKLDEDRETLLGLPETTLGWWDRRELRSLATRYKVSSEEDSMEALRATLILRVDRIPVALVLAQAAKESGWGTSRFAREGNNLFGEWCFVEGCGIVPKNRAPGRYHEVRAFKSAAASVESYLLNLNSHRAYRTLRSIRSNLRAQGKEPSGIALAAGLGQYSERGEVYVEEVRRLIRGNDLE